MSTIEKINEMIKQNDIQVKDLTINGKCHLGCGECCTDMIALTKSEYKTIREFIKRMGIKQEKWITEKGVHHLCPFLNKETKACNIYPVRPQVCRTFLCNKPIEDIRAMKELNLMRAYFNSSHGNMISLHRLFYGDVNREAFFWETNYKQTKLTLTLEQFLERMPIYEPDQIRQVYSTDNE